MDKKRMLEAICEHTSKRRYLQPKKPVEIVFLEEEKRYMLTEYTVKSKNESGDTATWFVEEFDDAQLSGQLFIRSADEIEQTAENFDWDALENGQVHVLITPETAEDFLEACKKRGFDDIGHLQAIKEQLQGGCFVYFDAAFNAFNIDVDMMDDDLNYTDTIKWALA